MAPKTGDARILLVEDSEGDIRLTDEAFRVASPMPVELDIARSGEDALLLLRRTGEPSRARPDLVLLDLSLPRMSGLEVLSEIKGDPDLRSIPVIVLSASSHARDIRDAYELHANCYIIKPTGMSKLLETVRRIGEFWLDLVEAPRSR